jgi:hypothetical protein
VPDDPVRDVHRRHLAERPLLLGHPPKEVVVVLPDQRLPVTRVLHLIFRVHLSGGHRHVAPAGLLEELPAGGGVEVLPVFDPAAGGGPVLPFGRRVVVAEEQHPPRRVDRDHPSRQPHGQLRFFHPAIVRHGAARLVLPSVALSRLGPAQRHTATGQQVPTR